MIKGNKVDTITQSKLNRDTTRAAEPYEAGAVGVAGVIRRVRHAENLSAIGR